MHRIQSCVDVCFHTFKKFFLLFPFDPFTSSAETVGLTLGWLVVLDLLPGILLLLEVILWWLSSTLEFEQRGRDLTTASQTAITVEPCHEGNKSKRPFLFNEKSSLMEELS
jgi:hypothetical protein